MGTDNSLLRVECTKCDRKGRYNVAKLIERHGRRGNMMKWKEQLNGDCPKHDSRLYDRCDLVCPDLPKVSKTRSATRGIAWMRQEKAPQGAGLSIGVVPGTMGTTGD